MQPVMARRRREWAELRRVAPGYDPGAQWQCWTGGPNDPDYWCPPARPDLGAPEIQHCGYRNPGRARVWTAILAGYGVGSPPPALRPGECVTHLEPKPHTHCAPAEAMHPEPGNYMNLKNLAEIEAYAAETRGMLATDPHGLPGWASHFLSVARSHVGDVKHFVEYHQTQHGDAMPGYSAGYAHDGGGGGPYGYPQTYQAFGVYSPLRRRRARRMMLEGFRPYGPYGGEVIHAQGYSAGRYPKRALSGVAVVRMPFPNSQGIAPAKPGMREGDEFKAVLPDGTQRMMICCGGFCCYVGDPPGACWKLIGDCTRKRLGMAPKPQQGASAPRPALMRYAIGGSGESYGAPPTSYGGLTSASARSASRVRRYNLLARRQQEGMSVGGCGAGYSAGYPMTDAQAAAMRSVLTEHGYSAGSQAAGVRPRLNYNWPNADRAFGYPWTPASGGVFWGRQNPLRRAEAMREHPSGFQNGFAVGGDGGGCGCG